MPSRMEDLFNRMPARRFEPALPRDAVEEFRANGFFTLDRITTDEEIAWLQEIYDALFTGEGGVYVLRDVNTRIDQQRGDRISQIIRPENYFPALKDTVFWHNS